ncbi:MAG: hypothetical protein CMK60_12450 [Proteobacteria bacterium]|jgi:uncharacterized protein YjiS (DUF1127 family)|nr:hypothetical protein [Pseudomonadota bacterium]MBP09940.1 hypothetical protein [Acidiferrobacteraceae bacterium]MDP6138026.1 DUF1127 domain-containing protein [Arenicellales bacterium]MDP6391524.1 DUF1127 domain-containing protein [Arenicellales bacterium]MDP7218976.1 DUF1127 domain-containing protein [Arenicellales bacterium]|tara:strand:+ start:590 stop:1024 length:435 start_codon:yes stop_codon:yes gene_type:complete
MSRALESYPEQTVAQWVAANDAHVLPPSKVPADSGLLISAILADHEKYVALARKMRAQAFQDVFRGLGEFLFQTAPSALARGLVSLTRTAAKRRHERRAQRAIAALSPHLLADIGLEPWQRAELRSGHMRTAELVRLAVLKQIG